MSEAAPRVVVQGAGAIGGWIGGCWAAAGLPVRLIARQPIKNEIEADGLHLTEIGGRRLDLQPAQVPVTTSPKVLAEADIIALCVKSTATEAAAKEIARHARKGAAVISFQNGVSNPERLRALLPGLEVLQAVVPFNVARLGNGRWHKGTSGDLLIEDHPRARDLAARIGDAPGRLKPTDDIGGLAWGKLLINLNNAVNALSGRTLLEQLMERDYRRVVAAAQVEALAVLKAAGIKPAQFGPIAPHLLPHAIGAPDFLFKKLVLKVQRIDPHARSSMADDFAAGRSTEIDFLNGEVVKLAKSLGLRAPVNQVVSALVRQAEAGVERTWEPKDLWAHVRRFYRPNPALGY